MATDEEKIEDLNPADDGFTHADEVLVDGEILVPENDPDSSRVDPDSFTTSKQLKEEAEEEEEGKKETVGNEDSHRNLKSTLIISGAVVAVIGAILAIVKKVKEA